MSAIEKTVITVDLTGEQADSFINWMLDTPPVSVTDRDQLIPLAVELNKLRRRCPEAKLRNIAH